MTTSPVVFLKEKKMSDNNVVKIEPKIRRSKPKRKTKRPRKSQPQLVNLEQVAGRGVITLGAAIANSGVSLLDLRERRKMRMLLLQMAGALMVLLGTFKMALMLMQH